MSIQRRVRPRFKPHDPATLDRIYRFYTRCQGAEFSAQQLCLRRMAESCHRVAWLLRVEKGLHDLLERGDDLAETHWEHLDELARDRELWINLFDRAFERFIALRATRNASDLHHTLTGQERYPVPTPTLLPDLAFALVPNGPAQWPAPGAPSP